jgi:tRNA-dihydrouridine synthase
MFQAQTIHRRNFDPNHVETASLLSIKIGGCLEDCGCCSQSAHYDTGVKATRLMDQAHVVATADADALVVHARKAWLKGLSPRENRDVPPLDCALVYRLKAELPRVPIVINGGIASLDEARRHLQHVDGVMLGRTAYKESWRLLAVDTEIFGKMDGPILD